jgi:signal transduction histidine kinase
MMNLHRLLRTTALRLTLRYALYYALLISLGLAVLYWATSRYVDAQIATGLEREITQFAQIDRQQGRARLIAAIDAEEKSVSGENLRYYLLQSPQGENQAGNLVDWPHDLGTDNAVRNIWIEDDLIPKQMPDDDGYWPMIGTLLSDGSRLLIAQSVRQAEDLQEFILSAMAVILVMSVGLALAMGWFLGRTFLERIDKINRTAELVAAGELSKRVAVSARDDEFDELATHLNAMLEQIEHLLTGMREVTDNVAHDLRKPLTRMRNRIEVTLLDQRETDEYRRALEETMVDANELMQTFNALLEIAQAEAGSFRGEWVEVDLSKLLQDIGELYLDEAEGHPGRFEFHIEPGLHVKGNRHLLAQAVSNLLDNAFKYTPDDCVIRLIAKSADGRVITSVVDGGPGIPARQRLHVLERFVRLDADRNKTGNGLGLSLVKAVAGLHRAELRLDDNQPGLRVELLFTT